MKISKLFHWLYATLMLLPFIFLLPTLAYYGFNEHATNTETTTINYKYQSNEVNSLDDIVENNIYELENISLSYTDDDYILDLCIVSFDTTDEVINYLSQNSNFVDLGLNRHYDNKDSYFKLSIDSGEMFITFPHSKDLISGFVYSDYDIQLNNVIFYIGELNLNDFNDWFTNYGNDLPHYTDYNVIESVEVNTDNTITGQVSRAWDSVWNLPLFSWTHNSFVSEPFTYITGLFGMSADNPFNYVVTYFVSISVCWLVFDFLMYVPNLAHRWLDKGALE